MALFVELFLHGAIHRVHAYFMTSEVLIKANYMYASSMYYIGMGNNV